MCNAISHDRLKPSVLSHFIVIVIIIITFIIILFFFFAPDSQLNMHVVALNILCIFNGFFQDIYTG